MWKMSEASIIKIIKFKTCLHEVQIKVARVPSVTLINLVRWLVDLATKRLSSCARKHTGKTTSNTQACEIHPFHAIQGKYIA